MTEIPQDLSCLTHVEEINLNGINFDQLTDVIISLTTMPQLKSLHIPLHEESQVDFIFRTLPNLQYLNDTEVEREDVSHLEEEEEEVENGDMEVADDNNGEEARDEPMQEEGADDEEDDEAENQPEAIVEIEDYEIKPEELESIAVLYDQI